MAVETPPFALSGAGATYTAEQARRAFFMSYQRTGANTPGILNGGLASAGDMLLSAPGSGLSVNVGVGEAIVAGSTPAQSGYYCYNKTTSNCSISTASGSHPRVDTVIAVVNDTGYTAPAGGYTGNAWTVAVVTGTATAGATLANLSGAGIAPSDSLTLGYVLVPTSATSIVSGDILNLGTTVMPQFTDNFLQLLSARSLRVAYGSASATFPSSSAETTAVTIPHGLGAIPVYASGFFSQNGSTAAAFVVQQSNTPDNTNLYLYGWTSTPVGSSTTIPISWIALG